MLNNFFLKNGAIFEIMWKNMVEPAGHRCQYDMAQALCLLDKQGYKHTLGELNTFCCALQFWLGERASQLRYTCISSLTSNRRSNMTNQMCHYTECN